MDATFKDNDEERRNDCAVTAKFKDIWVWKLLFQAKFKENRQW